MTCNLNSSSVNKENSGLLKVRLTYTVVVFLSESRNGLQYKIYSYDKIESEIYLCNQCSFSRNTLQYFIFSLGTLALKFASNILEIRPFFWDKVMTRHN